MSALNHRIAGFLMGSMCLAFPGMVFSQHPESNRTPDAAPVLIVPESSIIAEGQQHQESAKLPPAPKGYGETPASAAEYPHMRNFNYQSHTLDHLTHPRSQNLPTSSQVLPGQPMPAGDTGDLVQASMNNQAPVSTTPKTEVVSRPMPGYARPMATSDEYFQSRSLFRRFMNGFSGRTNYNYQRPNYNYTPRYVRQVEGDNYSTVEQQVVPTPVPMAGANTTLPSSMASSGPDIFEGNPQPAKVELSTATPSQDEVKSIPPVEKWGSSEVAEPKEPAIKDNGKPIAIPLMPANDSAVSTQEEPVELLSAPSEQHEVMTQAAKQDKVAEPVKAEPIAGPMGSYANYCQSPECCDCCAPRCLPPNHFWVRAEYLLWWIKGNEVPPLLTTQDPNQVVPLQPVGALNQPGVQVVVGGNDLNHNEFSGGRLSFGYWLNPCSCKPLGIEFTVFALGQERTGIDCSSCDQPILARPFTTPDGMPSSELAAFEDLIIGCVDIENRSTLWGSELNLRRVCRCCCNYRVECIAGLRYLDLDESITVLERVRVVEDFPDPDFADRNFVVYDQFGTRNQFYGAQIGMEGTYQLKKWFVRCLGKIAIGATHQEVDIVGATRRTNPDNSIEDFPGGLLALNSNIGNHTRDQFSVVPEIGITVGYQVTKKVRAYVGYTFMYWSNVVRPGTEIDTVIDPTQVPSFREPPPVNPNATRPMVLFNDTDFWAQGVNFGVECGW